MSFVPGKVDAAIIATLRTIVKNLPGLPNGIPGGIFDGKLAASIVAV